MFHLPIFGIWIGKSNPDFRDLILREVIGDKLNEDSEKNDIG